MSYDCSHEPQCVNQRHHVSRFYTERAERSPYAEAVDLKMQAMGEGLAMYVGMLPEPLQEPVMQHLLSEPSDGGTKE